jgi:hypothetical protein
MQVALTKAASTLAQVELLMVAISGGSDGLLTTASHQGAEYRCDSSSETFVLFFLLRVIHQHYCNLSLSKLVNSHFLDER